MAWASTALNVVTSWLFWIIVVIAIVVFVMLMLFIMKKRKFKFPCLIQYDLGNGKIGVETKKCGWFKTKKLFFGLLDFRGERRLETNDKRVVYQGSSQDFHEVNHKRGILCYAKPDDPKVLFPIKRIEITNGNLVEAVAPADYRDTSAKILQEAQKETQSNWERVAQYVALGLLAIVVLVCIIIVIQFANKNISESNAILNEALDKKAAIIQGMNVVPSDTAP